MIYSIQAIHFTQLLYTQTTVKTLNIRPSIKKTGDQCNYAKICFKYLKNWLLDSHMRNGMPKLQIEWYIDTCKHTAKLR